MLSNRDLVDLDLETYAVIRNMLFLLFSQMTQIFYELYTLYLDVLLNKVLCQRVPCCKCLCKVNIWLLWQHVT